MRRRSPKVRLRVGMGMCVCVCVCVLCAVCQWTSVYEDSLLGVKTMGETKEFHARVNRDLADDFEISPMGQKGPRMGSRCGLIRLDQNRARPK